MKTRRILILAALALVLLVAFFSIRRSATKSFPPFGEKLTISNTISTAPASQPTNVALTKEQNSLASRQTAVNELHRSATIQPIEFYGRIVDQSANAIPGVEIDYIIYPTPSPPDPGVGKTRSDSNGRFSVSGHMGSRISFALKKDGFRPAEPHSGATYSLLEPASERYTPDSANPQILHMWKESAPEELVEIDQKYECNLPEGTMRIDLLSARAVETGGDLKIEISRDPKSRSPGLNFNWKCIVSAIDGGLKVARNLEEVDTTFEAPLEGYTNHFEVRMGEEDVKWQSNISKDLYLKSRNGAVYAKFMLMITLNSETKASVWVRRGVANPRGSRIFGK